MENCTIWITYHGDRLVGEYGLKEDSMHRLFAGHKDIVGKNINYLNAVYCELATMYYVWKNNIRSNYVGFNHYRRQFGVNRMPEKGECQVYRIRDFGAKTIYEQYAECHNAADMDVMLDCIDNRHGINNPYSKYIKESPVLLSNCCFLMKWNDFTKLCKFVFTLLDDFAASYGISNTNIEEWRNKAINDFGGNNTDYQMRVAAFLGERLISAWITSNMHPYLEGRDIAVVHYNTPKLLDAAIRSVMKHTAGCHFFVFDNSDEQPFVPSDEMKGVVTVFDNTKGQIIDFEKELGKYPDKQVNDINLSNYGSAKHTMSVDKLMELIPDGFVLMDSDVLIKEDISSLWNKNVACLGAEETKNDVPLLMPFLCWLNVPVLQENGIRYFNGEKMWALTDKVPNCYYDTGAWLLEEVRNKGLNVGYINIWQYVEHFSHGSWRGSEERIDDWLKENESLWV